MTIFKNNFPSVITLLNLLCGCIALVFVSKNKLDLAFYFLILGILFDFFDGFFARLFNTSSDLGIQLDSLADMVTSGVVPGYVMFSLMENSSNPNHYFSFFGFIITLASCYRLANFNIDPLQKDSFVGLPTPANAILILSLPLVLKNSNSLLILEILTNQWFLFAISLSSAFLLNSKIVLFSLKIQNFSFTRYKLQILFLIISSLLLILFKFIAIPIIIISYILLSIVNNKFISNKGF